VRMVERESSKPRRASFFWLCNLHGFAFDFQIRHIEQQRENQSPSVRTNGHQAKIALLTRTAPERCAAFRERCRFLPAVLGNTDSDGAPIDAEPEPRYQRNLGLLRCAIDADHRSEQDRQPSIGSAQRSRRAPRRG